MSLFSNSLPYTPISWIWKFIEIPISGSFFRKLNRSPMRTHPPSFRPSLPFLLSEYIYTVVNIRLGNLSNFKITFPTDRRPYLLQTQSSPSFPKHMSPLSVLHLLNLRGSRSSVSILLVPLSFLETKLLCLLRKKSDLPFSSSINLFMFFFLCSTVFILRVFHLLSLIKISVRRTSLPQVVPF